MMIRFKGIDIVIPPASEMRIFSEEQYKQAVNILDEVEKQNNGNDPIIKTQVLISMFPMFATLYLAPIVFGEYDEDKVRLTFIDVDGYPDKGHMVMIGSLFCAAVTNELLNRLKPKN